MSKVFIASILAVALMAAPSCSKNKGNDSSDSKSAKQTDLVVFAAASLKESLEEIQKEYKKVNPGVNLMFNFDSSGTLLKQIKNGASVDVFISAAPKQMNDLHDNNYLDNSTMANFLQNEVVLAVPEGNPKKLSSFDDLNEHLRKGDIFIAIGNSDVPVGQYTQKIFAYYSLNEDDLNKKGLLTYGGNVKEVTTAVKEGLVDAGIIYSTDAYSAGLTKAASATKEMCGEVIYPIGILKDAPNRSEADKFYDFLKTETAKKEFRKVGFVPLI